MISKHILLVTIAIISTVSAEVTTLTAENFDEVTSGKKVFVKLYAPWCGHCKALAPTWEDLATKKADSGVTIAEMDCTAGTNKDKCSSLGVTGYPTIVYSKGFGFEKYTNGRTIDDLTTFVDDELGETCLDDRDLCNEEDSVLLKGYESYTTEELNNTIEKAKKRKEDAAATFTTQVEDLNKKYESYKTTKADEVKKASRTIAFATHVLSLREPKDVEVTPEGNTVEEL